MERYHIFKLGLAILFYAAYCVRPMLVNAQKIDDVATENHTKLDESDFFFYQGVQGKPGVDFPVLSHIPRTTFSCRDVDSGYYADLETDCQVFHICEENKKISFLCPNGTIFQQSELICEWWFKVNCTNSPSLYEESAEQLREENARRKSSRKVQNHGAVMRMEERSSVSVVKNENRRMYTNHASEYREVDNNDLSKSSSSDFVRNGLNRPAPFRNKEEEEEGRKNHRGRKPVQFQKQASVDNEERKSTRTPQRRKPVKQQNSNRVKVNQNRSQSSFNSQPAPFRYNGDQNQFSTRVNNQKVSTTERNQFNNQPSPFINKNRKTERLSNERNSFSTRSNSQLTHQSQNYASTTERSVVSSTQFENFASTTERNHFSTQFDNQRQDQNQNFDDQSSFNNGQFGSTRTEFSAQTSGQNYNFVSTTESTVFSKATPQSTNVRAPSFTFSEDFGTSTLKSNNNVLSTKSSTQQPLPLSVSPQKKVTTDAKDGTIKPKGFFTKNDIVTRRLEPSESDETQITQETASFVKNSFNRIDQERKVTNPYPNHRETYSDIKEPKYHSTKSYATISSVTPQYLTTQPFNSGRPFFGNQVGTTLRGLTTTLLPPFGGTNPTTELFNIGRTDKSLPVTFQTTTTERTVNVTAPSDGSFNTTPRSGGTTARVLDHATVYGKFVKSGATTPSVASTTTTTKPPERKIIHLSKSLFGATPSPVVKGEKAEILTVADSYNRGVPQVRFFGKVQTTKAPKTTFYPKSSFSPQPLSLNSIESSTVRPKATTATTGFFVTKNITPTTSSRIGKIVRPRPFQLPPEPDVAAKPVYSSATPTVPAYKISSASPFVDPSTPEPTLPTPFTTAKPTLPSTFEDVDSMITTLAEMAGNFTEPRPGLVIPPSAGPQTLHTLAVYFANALDGIAGEKEEGDGEGAEEDLSKNDVEEKKKLTELLTQMTMDRYNELFSEEQVTKSSEDLETQNSKGPVQTEPKVRQLAKVFTQALSSYLDDPATFRKVLEEIRPTEPPETEDLADDELLNFSDADSKSSFPPFYPTLPSVRPTWGYLIALNTSNSLSDSENLQGADSQSFISQLNKLKNEETTKSSTQLPEDHWTTSPDVNHLWKKAFSFDPASINENFGTTEPTFVTTETEAPEVIKDEHHEIKYELHALPHIGLNSTQVHGILIDFMNTTKNDDTNRLQRILKKLNTTEDEFLAKMKEIESNPLTRRLILLLINECGSNSTQAVPVQTLLAPKAEILDTASSDHYQNKGNSNYGIVAPQLAGDNQDSRALQLLNSLYTIASKFGK